MRHVRLFAAALMLGTLAWANPADAQFTLDWGDAAAAGHWAEGVTNGVIPNVGGSGINVTYNVVVPSPGAEACRFARPSDGPAVIQTNPLVTTIDGDVFLGLGFCNPVEVTFTFSRPVQNLRFAFWDVDQSRPDTGRPFDDRVVLTATPSQIPVLGPGSLVQVNTSNDFEGRQNPTNGSGTEENDPRSRVNVSYASTLTSVRIEAFNGMDNPDLGLIHLANLQFAPAGCSDTTSGNVDLGCAFPTPACRERDNTCVRCTANADCAGAGVCDTATNSCINCRDSAPQAADEGCPDTLPACLELVSGNRCAECDRDSQCRGGEVCDEDTNACVPCDDDSIAGVDSGCTGSQPACVGTGDSAMCTSCQDTAGPGAIDSGCMNPSPICNTGVSPAVCVQCTQNTDCPSGTCNTALNQCVLCTDNTNGGTDSGCSMGTPVCGAPPAGGAVRCIQCEDNVSGGVDNGCGGDRPACNTSMFPPRCVECAQNSDCPGGTCSSTGVCTTGPDNDSDGVPDTDDPDDDNDGILDTEEGSDDPDGDGIPSWFDLDSDGDGLPDVIEGGAADSNGDGLLDSTTDADNDGLIDLADPDQGGTALPTPDFDMDGKDNYKDVDSDADGITDAFEAGGNDANGDGILDTPADGDGDGLAEIVDQPNGGTPLIQPNTDGDGNPDWLDLDSDGDLVPDLIEGHDNDSNGVPDRTPSGTDTDNDGLDDAFDASNGGSPAPTQDTNADGTPDFRDTDDDGDTLGTNPDEDRNGNGDLSDDDTDGDGIPDYLDRDDDNDGRNTDVEISDGTTFGTGPDPDGDGIPNHYDLDSDGDGSPDGTENLGGGGSGDDDGNGTPDYLEPGAGPTDTDMDGLPDAFECPGGIATCPDTDMDGLPDHMDPDDDNDTIPTAMESAPMRDTDSDGIPDYLDPDDDNDTIPTAEEASLGDTDGDGRPNPYDPDDDQDGIPTRTEKGDADRLMMPDVDGDGMPNWLDQSSDPDAFGDREECPSSEGGACPDSDANGIPDYLDGGSAPMNPDDQDLDGILDVDECPSGIATCRDSDNDGTPDYLDSDDDNDGVPTRVEDVNGFGDARDDDTDMDGTPNYLDTDDDNDGILTRNEDYDGPGGMGDGMPQNDNTDSDMLPDYLDADDDNDGIPTSKELADGNIWGLDADGDGLENWRDTESDGPGHLDSDECPAYMGGDCPDSDGQNGPDYLDNMGEGPTNPGVTNGPGFAGGAPCGSVAGGSGYTHAALFFAAVGLIGLLRRRR